MTIYSVDRCTVCKGTVDLEWSAVVCRHDVVFCEFCDERLGCVDCDNAWAEGGEESSDD